MTTVAENVPAGYSEFNPEIFTDGRLSFRSLGILMHLLVLPPNTPIRVVDLLKHAKGHEGRDSIRVALRELEAAGYLRRGQGTSWVWNGDPSKWITRDSEKTRRHAG